MPPETPRPFAANIGRKGRVIRGAAGAALLAIAAVVWQFPIALAALLIAGGLFLIFEALRGWCVLRACRVRTRF